MRPRCACCGRPKRRGRGFITTDYVIDETATLLKARQFRHLIQAFFETLEASNACRVQWTESERFQQVQRFYVKHSDQDWSFTDCLSFCVMTELRLREALTTAVHFVQAGFKALLK